MLRPARHPFSFSFSFAALSTLSAALGLALVAAGCTPEAITLKKIGDACTVDGDCGKMLCSKTDLVCTRPCTAQVDCPSGFDCGLAHPEDGKPGSLGASCYKSKVVSAAMGGFGVECGAWSPDPNSLDTPCNDMAKNPCASGFTCLGQVKCDAAAYCTRSCASDADCPPSMMCATDVARSACKSDSDCSNGYTCQPSAPGGKAKVCTGQRWCRKRAQCAPCATDDQCPAGYTCATDDRGERYCGKLCEDDNQCPTPPPSSTGYFYKCVDGKNGKTVCQPLQGACHGVSNQVDVMPASACAWCRDGIPSDCPDSYCYLSFTGEHFCPGLCTMKYAAGKFDTKTDTCPDGLVCLVPRLPADCNGNCDAPGFCTADPMKQQLTCFPE